MAIHAQTSCTLSTITDVEAVYTYYYLSDSTITVDEAPKDGVNAPGAQTITVISDGESYIWQLTEPELDIEDDVIQTAVGKLYYIECVKFSNGTYDWGPLMTSSTYAAAKAAYNLSYQAIGQAQSANRATALLGGHFIYNSEWQTSNTPHSANVVQTVTSNGIDVSNDPTKWAYNTHIGANGIRLRYNEIILSEWKTNSLIFYIPTQENNDWIQGEKGLEITATGIDIYSPDGHKGLGIDNNGMIIYDNNTTPEPVIVIKKDFFSLGFDLTELNETFDPYSSVTEMPFIIWQKDSQDTSLYEYLDDIIIKNSPNRYSLKQKINTIETDIITNTNDINVIITDYIPSIRDNIDTIENSLNVANHNIATNANNILINTQNINTNNNNISKINARINKIKAYWKINTNNHLILVEEDL